MLRSRPTRFALTAAAMSLVVSGALFLAFTTGNSEEPPPSPLRTVSTELLEGSALVLTLPSPDDQASYSGGGAAARDLVLAGRPKDEVVELVLFNVEDRLSDPSVECLCWVVVLSSQDPVYAAQPRGSDWQFEAESSFRLALVDARTGKFMYGVEGAHGRTVAR